MKKTLEVKTGTDEYKILIGDNILLSSGSLIKKKLEYLKIEKFLQRILMVLAVHCLAQSLRFYHVENL